MMAEAVASGSESQVITQQDNQESVVLRLHKPKTGKVVKWKEGTVDNEFMGKKSSKCCCIYTKPHKFDESGSESSDSDGECCHEHRVARRHVPKSQPPVQGPAS